jgi:predicted enzyme related to lactoylglutathione lyase
MINYRIADLGWLVAQLRAEGVEVDGESENYDYGRFVRLTNREGNRVELWQPRP